MKKKDKKELLNICEEAHYRALKKIIDEQKNDEKTEETKKVIGHRKWYEEVLFFINIFLCPWKTNKKFQINDKIYDGILVFFVSAILEVSGTLIWGVGLLTASVNIFTQIKEGSYIGIIESLGLGALSLVFGSLLILSGKEFSKVTDSNKIYAYSASLIALISCIITLLSLAQ